jgi:hypothetical protein
MTDSQERKDITQGPSESELQDAYQEVGKALQEEFPELGIPGANIIFTEEPVNSDKAAEMPVISPTEKS